MAATHLEHESVLLHRRAVRPTSSTTGSIEDRLTRRRQQVASMRQLVVLGDAVVTLGVVAGCLAGGHLASALMATAVL